ESGVWSVARKLLVEPLAELLDGLAATSGQARGPDGSILRLRHRFPVGRGVVSPTRNCGRFLSGVGRRDGVPGRPELGVALGVRVAPLRLAKSLDESL